MSTHTKENIIFDSKLPPGWFSVAQGAEVDAEHIYMRLEVNSNQFEISLWGKISLRCELTSLPAFT